MVRPHANIWYMILYVHTCCFFLSCFLSYVVYYATWLFTCMPEYICSIFKVCFSFSCIFSTFMYVYLMYMCPFLLQRTQDRCSVYEECARCEKGLQSSDTDCNQLRDEQGCNTTLYTNDTAPSKYLHVHTGMLCMHTDTYLSCTLLKTSLCYCIHMCLCFHFIILFWIISWDSLKEDAIHVYKRCYLCSLFMPSCPHTVIPTHSFCGFWHCHPYIPLHVWKMFSTAIHVSLCTSILILTPPGTHTEECSFKDSDDCTHRFYLSLPFTTVLVDDDKGTYVLTKKLIDQ